MGFAQPPVLLTSLIIVPFVFLGMKLGTLIGPRIDPVVFKRCLLSLLGISSLYMVIQGSSEELPAPELEENDGRFKNGRTESETVLIHGKILLANPLDYLELFWK